MKGFYITILIITLVFSLGCGDGGSTGGNGGENGDNGGDGGSDGGNGGNGGHTFPEGDISMITPYESVSDMQSINEAYSSDASAPWGFAHNGIDFFPTSSLKPFWAVSSGLVERSELWQNDITGNWQVNIEIKYNSAYTVTYNFEPMTASQLDGETQLSNILISDGQSVSQGERIGLLYAVGEGAHIHFSLYKDDSAICPEDYFTAAAGESILGLIHKDHPDWNMCY